MDEIHVYNTMTGSIEKFVPLNPPQVKMYACGITVYDEAHIGHASQAIIFDVIRRWLGYRGYEVNYVRNFTDIDDKIIAKSVETGMPAKKISEKFIEETRRDLAVLRVQPATSEPTVTDHVGDIIEFISKLIEMDYAYESDGDVYFAIARAASYGRLSNRTVANAASEESGAGKQHPADFALWKQAKPGEPSWSSPWGGGRPGWHIECSVLAQRHLGETVDIHGGGLDLVFPHHENEIVQSESLTGKPLARYWVHNGLVMVDGRKMSKSLGNFYTIKKALARYTVDIIRYVVLSHHYSSHIDFSEDTFRDAEKRVFYYYKTLYKADRFLKKAQRIGRVGARDPGQAAGSTPGRHFGLIETFEKSMDHNFNTAKAIAVLAKSFSRINGLIEDSSVPSNEKAVKLNEIMTDMKPVTRILQLFNEDPGTALQFYTERALKHRGLTADAIEKKIQERSAARERKNYALADQIRERLEENGIRLMDSAEGTAWELSL